MPGDVRGARARYSVEFDRRKHARALSPYMYRRTHTYGRTHRAGALVGSAEPGAEPSSFEIGCKPGMLRRAAAALGPLAHEALDGWERIRYHFEMFEVREYVRVDGASPFRTWFLGLDTQARGIVDEVIARMRLGNLGDRKSVGKGVIERRIDSGPGYRIYFGRDGDTLVLLLLGSTKRRQSRAIESAQNLWEEYKRRKRRGE